MITLTEKQALNVMSVLTKAKKPTKWLEKKMTKPEVVTTKKKVSKK